LNKYMGFYELQNINIPTIPWKRYTGDEKLDDNYLWTLRVAVENSNDLNLPRVIGATAKEAEEKGKELLRRFNNELVVYYPFFIAEKSGVLDVNNSRTIIEAVDKDLWNLVTYGNRNVTISITSEGASYFGEENFLKEEELSELKRCSEIIKKKFRDIISEGQSILAEWSFAYKSDKYSNPIGEKFIVFYELRSVR